MYRRNLSSLALSVVLAAGMSVGVGLVGSSSALGQVGTSVTYQGQLKNNGVAVNSPADVRFSIWDAATAGNQIGTTDTKTAVPVSQGLFSTTFDCGVNPYTADAARWLQIEVRNPSNVGGFVLLGARQRLTAAPFSIFSNATRGITVDANNNLSTNLNSTVTVSTSGPNAKGFIHSRGGQSFGTWAGNGCEPSLGIGTFTNSGFNFFINKDNVQCGTVAAFDGNGNFCIGNPYPQARLDVRGGDAIFSNDVGIGVTDPEARLDINGRFQSRGASGSGGGMSMTDSGSPTTFRSFFGRDTDANAFTGVFSAAAGAWTFVARDNGNIGIGTIAPFNRLDVAAGSTIGNSTLIGSEFNDSANRGLKVGFGYHTPADNCGPDNFRGMRVEVVPGTTFCGNSTDLTFWTDECNTSCPREVMRINGSGNVGIGTASPGAFDGFRLDVGGNIRCVTLTETSSREFKQDIVPLTGALDSIMKLKGVTYAWNDLAPEPVRGAHDIGFIADEMNEVLPDLVAKDASGKPVGINYSKITPVAVEAIKQLKTENDQLKARLEKIEALLAAQAANTGK